MRILIAPNPFKGSLSSREAAQSIARGLRRAMPNAELDLAPLSDGGPGMLDALQSAPKTRTRRHWAQVAGPLGPDHSLVRAAWLELPGNAAAVESAQCLGLELLAPKARRPLKATSFGLGQLILKIYHLGFRKIYLGLGGSATTDGGSGMARALGWSFLDARGQPLALGGGTLAGLCQIVPPVANPLKGLKIQAWCDVQNPLTGPKGAARTYAPQKGASPKEVEILEGAIKRLDTVSGRGLGNIPGAGAAGGLGWGVMAFLKGSLVSGARSMLALSDFKRRVEKADWIISGEGTLDDQTFSGKLPHWICREAQKAGKNCLFVVGRYKNGGIHRRIAGKTKVIETQKGHSIDFSMKNANKLVENSVFELFSR